MDTGRMIANFKEEIIISALPKSVELPPDYIFVVMSRNPIDITGGNIALTCITYAVFEGGKNAIAVTFSLSKLAVGSSEYITIYGMSKSRDFRSQEMWGGSGIKSVLNDAWAANAALEVFPTDHFEAAGDLSRFFTTILISEIVIFRGDVITIKTAVPTDHITHLVFDDGTPTTIFRLINPVLAAGGSGVSADNFGFHWKAPTFSDCLMFPADGEINIYGDENAAITYYSGHIKYLAL